MDNEVSILLQVVREAGAAILKLQKEGFSVARKSNKDLVTQADLLANDMLKSTLQKHFPAYGWLSEETVDDKARLQCEYVWVVDPIDGTIEYAHGVPEYAISVALVRRGEPVIGVVYNPASNELFHAVKSKGMWFNGIPSFRGLSAESSVVNKRQLEATTLDSANKPRNDGLTLLASRSEYKRGEWDFFQAAHHVKVVGSIAYKLGLVAAGMADATFSLSPKNEWDIAAGTLLVLEAGGVVTDQYRQPFLFNQENVLVNGIVACASEVSDKLFGLINQSRSQ